MDYLFDMPTDFKVYKIKNNNNGYPTFLIYDENQWKWLSAKHFKPIEE